MKPTPEQTLRALDRVSRGEVWDATPQTDTWQHIGTASAQADHQYMEAAA